jgi:hypothetical protein
MSTQMEDFMIRRDDGRSAGTDLVTGNTQSMKRSLRLVAVSTFVVATLIVATVLFAAPVFAQERSVHELFYNDSVWVDTNLSALVPEANVQLGGVAAFETANKQLQVYYLGFDVPTLVDHIHHLEYDGHSWSDEDLTVLTGGVPPTGEGGVAGFAIGNAQYVYFVGTDNDAHELAFGTTWVDTNLTALTKVSFAYPYGLAAFQTTSNHQRNLFYLGPSLNVHELVFNGTAWTDQNLTKLTGGASGNDGWISAFAVGKTQYVFFESQNKHVQEFSFTTSWVAEDLTTANGLPKVTGDGVGAFAVGTKQIEAFYSATKTFHVHELSLKGGIWTDRDLTAQTGGPGGFLTPQTVGFATGKQLHVFLPGSPSGDINQFLYNGTTWSNEDLSVLSGGDLGTGSSGMAAYAVGKQERVYYVGQ